MKYFPAFMNIGEASCLVVGGGMTALRKTTLLLRAGAKVTVVSPELCEDMERLRSEGQVTHQGRDFQVSDIEGMRLVVAATDSRPVNQLVSETAKAQNILVNVVDQPDLCTFIVPSIVDRAPVLAAVSTEGSSPVLARMMRARIENIIPPGIARLAQLAAEFRDTVKQKLKESARIRAFWEAIMGGPVAELAFTGKMEEAREMLENRLSENLQSPQGQILEPGMVSLVGAGPGDPELLTMKAARLLAEADVLVYDRLVSQDIIDLARRDADKIYVGKERDNHALPQEEINALLIKLALEGKRVVRLKGGDPFLFGRGGEEIDALAAESIPFQIVPGITSASGCAAYTGIPLTHRDFAQSCLFITGHMKDLEKSFPDDFVPSPNQTLVIYMALHKIEKICAELVERGLEASTPIAVVEQGTTPNQRLITGSLDDISQRVREMEVKSPALIIVGQVVALKEKREPTTPTN